MTHQAADAANIAGDTAPETAGRAPRILVVDDERQVRRFIAESLRTLGYDVTDVDTGAAALELLDSKPFDL